ncbi:MAG: serine/threonine-protein kinase [Gracilibacteraceae bacterium]|jgi:serine/threonine protein kinase|nr:serine/threonine-protein kinase [Gracilibacteraceae bacterium]
MDELSEILGNIETDNQYVVIEVLKDSDFSRIEKVRKDGKVFIRKSFRAGQRTGYDLAALRSGHEALPRFYDSYRLADRFVVIEEFIEGITLCDYVQRNKKLPLDEAVMLTIELCKTISFLHSQIPPVIHRDIKPSNIFCTDQGLKLIDFSIARSFSPEKDSDTVYMGTVGYAPPEQFGFGQTDVRSDIYAVGMTFLYMLTGVEPRRHFDSNIMAALPDRIREIVRVSTEFAPQSRYSSADDMIKDLEDAKKDAMCVQTTEKLKSPGLISLGTALLFLALVVMGGIWLIAPDGKLRSDREEPYRPDGLTDYTDTRDDRGGGKACDVADTDDGEQIVVRNYFGENYIEVEQELREQGFLVEVFPRRSNDVAVNAVIYTYPTDNTIVTKGTSISLYYSVGS